MPHSTAGQSAQDVTTPQVRRSTRIKQQQPNALVTQSAARRASAKRIPPDDTRNIRRKRKREDIGNDFTDAQTAKKRPADCGSTKAPTQDDRPARKKRVVRFADGEPLEPLSIYFVDVEKAEEAAAAAVTAEFLLNRPENAQYENADVHTVTCPPEAQAKIAPTRSSDGKGRVLLQYPTRYVLAYKIEVTALYGHLKAVGREFIDVTGTMLAFLLRLNEVLGIRRGHGLSEKVCSENEATRPTRRGVRFDDDQPLEPLPDVEADEETVARAAAAAVTVQSLATRPENAQYANLDPRVFPCPPESRARFAPTRTLDSKGRVLLQYPIRYILAYRIEVGALYTYLKSVKRDLHDFQSTVLHFQLQLDEGLDMRRQEGMTEMVYMGRRIWSMIMSQSDRPETLPYPTARIQRSQEIMGSLLVSSSEVNFYGSVYQM
ncbi:hypothetical protein GGG16DRAFT_115537 [Schizophyllum commune]